MSLETFSLDEVDFMQWLKEVKKELATQSDRAVAVVCASILDHQLEGILSAFMIEEKEKTIDKDLFRGNTALSTFSSKIKMCYYLGLITEDEYKNIEWMRSIRNEFAHQLMNVSFDNNQSIKAKCNNLYIPKNRYVPEIMPVPLPNGEIPKINLNPFAEDDSPKNKYVQLFYFLANNFYARSFLISREKRKKYTYKLSTADEHRQMKETFLDTRAAMIKSQEERNKLEEKAGLKKTEFAETPLSDFMSRNIDILEYFAQVLEKSYEN